MLWKVSGVLLIEKSMLFSIYRLKFVVVMMMLVFSWCFEVSVMFVLLNFWILLVIMVVLLVRMLVNRSLLGMKVSCWCYGW